MSLDSANIVSQRSSNFANRYLRAGENVIEGMCASRRESRKFTIRPRDKLSRCINPADYRPSWHRICNWIQVVNSVTPRENRGPIWRKEFDGKKKFVRGCHMMDEFQHLRFDGNIYNPEIKFPFLLLALYSTDQRRRNLSKEPDGSLEKW